jgi:hypothetical protein
VPTGSVSSQVSEAVYFASVVGLALLLARPVFLVYSGAQERSAQAVAFGLGALIDSMSPGSSVRFDLQSYPGLALSAALTGTSVSVSVGGATATAAVRYPVVPCGLVSGHVYELTLERGVVRVAQARDG